MGDNTLIKDRNNAGGGDSTFKALSDGYGLMSEGYRVMADRLDVLIKMKGLYFN